MEYLVLSPGPGDGIVLYLQHQQSTAVIERNDMRILRIRHHTYMLT